MSAEERIARKRRRQDAKRDVILEAAADVLIEGGLEGFTVGAVAARADLSKPAVYYYFASREALLSSLLVVRFRAETNAMLAAIAGADGGVAALDRLVRAYVEHYRNDLESYRVLQLWALSATSQTELLATDLYPLSWELMGAIEAMLVEDREHGRLHADAKPRELANVAMMTAHGIVAMSMGMELLGGSMRFSVDAYVDEACATFRRACAP